MPEATVHVPFTTPRRQLEIPSGRRPEGQVAVKSTRCVETLEISKSKLPSNILSPLVPFLVFARKFKRTHLAWHFCECYDQGQLLCLCLIWVCLYASWAKGIGRC